MVYGSGSVGTRIAQRALGQGMEIVVAGRDPDRAAEAAGRLGVPWRSSPVARPDALDRLLDGVGVLVNTAGPFADTAAPLMRACLRSGCHYVDVSNELDTFRDAWSLAAGARDARVALVPGAGFGTAVTESLAGHVLARLPDADRLTIVRSSRGTVRTAGVRQTSRAVLAAGGARYLDGRLAAGFNRIAVFNLPDGRRAAVPAATGDLFATAHSTGVPNVAAYFATGMHPLAAVLAVPVMRRLTRAGLLPGARGTSVGPNAATARGAGQDTAAAAATDPAPDPVPDGEPDTARSQVWIQAAAPDGQTVTGWLQAGRGADISAAIAVETARRLGSGGPTGVLTSGALLGSGYVLALPGIRVTDL